MKKRVVREGAAINFDATPEQITQDVRRAVGECPWCGDETDDDDKCRRACASSRRVERKDHQS